MVSGEVVNFCGLLCLMIWVWRYRVVGVRGFRKDMVGIFDFGAIVADALCGRVLYQLGVLYSGWYRGGPALSIYHLAAFSG